MLCLNFGISAVQKGGEKWQTVDFSAFPPELSVMFSFSTRLNFELFGEKQMLVQSTLLWKYGDCLTLIYVKKLKQTLRETANKLKYVA